MSRGLAEPFVGCKQAAKKSTRQETLDAMEYMDSKVGKVKRSVRWHVISFWRLDACCAVEGREKSMAVEPARHASSTVLFNSHALSVEVLAGSWGAMTLSRGSSD